jgi:alkylated DNA repair dioxygenase AlkB
MGRRRPPKAYTFHSRKARFKVYCHSPGQQQALLQRILLTEGRQSLLCAIVCPVLTDDGNHDISASVQRPRQSPLAPRLHHLEDLRRTRPMPRIGNINDDNGESSGSSSDENSDESSDDSSSDSDKEYEHKERQCGHFPYHVFLEYRTAPARSSEQWGIAIFEGFDKAQQLAASTPQPTSKYNDEQDDFIADLLLQAHGEIVDPPRTASAVYGTPTLDERSTQRLVDGKYHTRADLDKVIADIRLYCRGRGSTESTFDRIKKMWRRAHELPITPRAHNLIAVEPPPRHDHPFFKHDRRDEWVSRFVGAGKSLDRLIYKPLVLWSKLGRFGKTEWAKSLGRHIWILGSLDPEQIHTGLLQGADVIILDNIKWHMLFGSDLGRALAEGQHRVKWLRRTGERVTTELTVPVIILNNKKCKTWGPNNKAYWRKHLEWVRVRKCLFDESKIINTDAPPAALPDAAALPPVPVAIPTLPVPVAVPDLPVPVAAPTLPVPVAAALPPVPIAASAVPAPVAVADRPVPVASLTLPAPDAAASAAVHAPALPLRFPPQDMMAEFKELDAALAPMEKPLFPAPQDAAIAWLNAAAAAAPAFSLTPTEKTMKEELPGTWIRYNVITPEVEAMLNHAAERQAGPWIEFIQSRQGKPLARLKKVQCVVSNGWIRWYWYPDTIPDEWLPLTPINARLAQLLTALCGGRYTLTSLVLHKYRDETDNIDDHHDKTGDLDPGSPIVTLSTGSLAREIHFTNQETFKVVKLTIPPRSVYVIGWETNQKWKHAIPPMKGVTGERYSWTFRSVVSMWNRVTHAQVQRPQIGADMSNWDVLLPVANPDRPELLASYKVVQTVRLAEPGRLQPSHLEQISEEAQAAYSGSTVRKASNPKHRKPMGKEVQAEKKRRKRSGKGVPNKKKKKKAVQSSSDEAVIE